jgi:hypothetical protein
MIALHPISLANRSSIFEQQLINSRLLIVYTKTLKLLVSPLSSCALFSVSPCLRVSVMRISLFPPDRAACSGWNKQPGELPAELI